MSFNGQGHPPLPSHNLSRAAQRRTIHKWIVLPQFQRLMVNAALEVWARQSSFCRSRIRSWGLLDTLNVGRLDP